MEDGRRMLREGWRFRFPGDAGIGEAEGVESLRALLGAAVHRQLASDLPVGSALSGGLDGAAIAMEARLDTFTVGCEEAFPRRGERALDERPSARALAAHLGTRHHEEAVTPEAALSDLPFLIRHLEEPRLAASFQNLAAARLALRHVTVVLSGGGGDELFAGYPWRYAGIRQAWDEAAFLSSWTRVLSKEGERGFWTDEGLQLISQGDPEGTLNRLAEEAGDCTPLHRAMSIEASTFLPSYCLLEDKLHMAVGAEVRVPFLDGALVDWAVRLPEALRLSEDGRAGKRLLRAALAGRLPPAAMEAPKQGFVPPLLSWAGREPWMSFLRGTLLGPRCRDRGLIRPEALARDVEALVAGRPEPLQRVWTSLAFELWCRAFLDRDGDGLYGK